MKKQINFDMDGTIADLYGVEGWLADLRNENARPYHDAKPMLNMSALARRLNKLQNSGYALVVISWGSMDSSADYLEAVRAEKLWWLNKHLPSVKWDKIEIVEYGSPKEAIGAGILFDDNDAIRRAWVENEDNVAFDVDNILEILKGLI